MISFQLKSIYDYFKEFSPTVKLFLKIQRNNILQTIFKVRENI